MEHRVPCVRLRLPDGRRREIGAGGIIGRLASAACRLDDPRVSEAHALLSLREGQLYLLALRGGLFTGGAPCRELRLESGMRVALAEGVFVDVLEVVLPETVLALELPSGQRVPLLGEVVSLVHEGGIVAASRFVEGALATLWSTGSGWRIAVGAARASDLHAGIIKLGMEPVRVVELALCELETPDTRAPGRLHPPIRLRPTFTSVRLEVDGMPPVLISGVPGRILSELCEFHEPVDWRIVAELVWPDEDDSFRLRRNWDRNLRTLRDKLAGAALRQDLVLLDGHGNVGLHLLEGDGLAL